MFMREISLPPDHHPIDSIIDLLSFVAIIFFLIRWTHDSIFGYLFITETFQLVVIEINYDNENAQFLFDWLLMRYNEVVKK